MKVQRVSLKEMRGSKQVVRSSTGGHPILSRQQEWPRCVLCQSRQVLFFQLDLVEKFGLPFQPRSHLSVFMCPKHNEVHFLSPEPPFKNYLIRPKHPYRRLPQGYWNRNPGHFKLILNPPGIPEKYLELEEHLVQQEMKFSQILEDPTDHGLGQITGIRGFKMGGIPSWIQDPEYYQCSCGGAMRFICQLPSMHPFPKMDKAESQPNSFSKEDYCLFLGNEVYLFGCEAQCDPHAVWPVLNN